MHTFAAIQKTMIFICNIVHYVHFNEWSVLDYCSHNKLL